MYCLINTLITAAVRWPRVVRQLDRHSSPVVVDIRRENTGRRVRLAGDVLVHHAVGLHQRPRLTVIQRILDFNAFAMPCNDNQRRANRELSTSNIVLHDDDYYYPVSQKKTGYRTLAHNTAICWPIFKILSPSGQWLKWFCEAGGLTWRSQVGANPIPILTPLIWRYLGIK